MNGTSPSPSFYTLVLFSTPNVQLARPKSGGRPDGVGLALLLKADDLGGAAIKMIDLRVRCRRALLGRGMSPHRPQHSRTGNCLGSMWSCSGPVPVSSTRGSRRSVLEGTNSHRAAIFRIRTKATIAPIAWTSSSGTTRQQGRQALFRWSTRTYIVLRLAKASACAGYTRNG